MDPANVIIGTVVVVVALWLLVAAVHAVWTAGRLVFGAGRLAAEHGPSIVAVLLQGYIGGGLGRTVALSLLTIAVLPIGLLAAFVIGAHDLD
ncbi:MAG: hypothetical protein AB7O49_10145 [Sphingomonadales bacterium]